MAQFVADFFNKSILKMYSSKRNKMLNIFYVMPKILKLTRDTCLKRLLKVKACVGTSLKVTNSLTCKQSFINFSKIENTHFQQNI